MPPGDIYQFGSFTFDTRAKRLTRGDETVPLAGRQFDLLHLFVARANQLLTKDALIQAAWSDVAVSDNSLERAISALRRTLSPHYITTESRRGYRFVADVSRVERRESDESLDALLAPHRAWLEGRAALETLERGAVVKAREAFEAVLAQMPTHAFAHVGLANACVMQFEMTRAEQAPDLRLLTTAAEHAREACRLEPAYAEAWATLGFVLSRMHLQGDALAASRRATVLEPDNWRHHLRLSYTSWGEERLREARRALSLLPGFPLAHFLAASVMIARQTFTQAERELRSGLEAVPTGSAATFTAVGLNYLCGLLALNDGRIDEAHAEFDRELAREQSGHLYAKECCANTWYAIAAAAWQQGHADAAGRALQEVLARTPRHPSGLAMRAALSGQPFTPAQRGDAHPSMAPVDAAIAMAVHRAVSGAGRVGAGDDGDGGAVAAALSSVGQGSSGWLLPLEPVLKPTTNAAAWSDVLAMLRQRAS